MPDNLAQRMQETLPAAELALLRLVAEGAGALRLPLYVVGGLPRDVLLGQVGRDFDLVVEGPAQQLAEWLAARHGGRVVVHRAFGTAKWEVPAEKRARPAASSLEGIAADALDIITARSETYRHPAALPTVTPGSIADDLRRRDFSINAIAIRLDGAHFGDVQDILGGRVDLDRGLVRVPHPQSFVDDPTRMYRAVRYEQRYRFRIEHETLQLIAAGREGARLLSPQRVRHELDLILDEANAGSMLGRLEELGLLGVIHPALRFEQAAATRLLAADGAPQLEVPAVPRRGLRWLLWLMGLPPGEIEAIDKRLHFTAALLKDLLGAAGLRAQVDALVGLSPSGWTERLKDVPPAAAYAVYLALPRGPARAALLSYLSAWRHIRPRTTGHDLQRLGVKPGVEYQRILRELRRAWLDGDIQSVEQEHAYLHSLLGR